MTCAETGNVDHIRGLTVFLDNESGTEELCKNVELCPGARIYAYDISVRTIADPIPDVVATLKLQDSAIEVPSWGCKIAELAASLPGLAWPSFAKLCAPPGSKVALVLTYGHCA